MGFNGKNGEEAYSRVWAKVEKWESMKASQGTEALGNAEVQGLGNSVCGLNHEMAWKARINV